MKVIHLHEQVVRGEYEVDAHAVADAIVRRLLDDHRAHDASPGRSSD